MPLDSLLVEILVDPIDHGSLLYFEDEQLLYNPRRKVAFAVNDGIPVVLPDEGRAVEAEEAARLEAASGTAVATGSGPSA